MHSAMNSADRKSPLLQLLDQVIERVLEFGEDEESLLRIVKEALPLQQVLQIRELRFTLRLFNPNRVLHQFV